MDRTLTAWFRAAPFANALHFRLRGPRHLAVIALASALAGSCSPPTTPPAPTDAPPAATPSPTRLSATPTPALEARIDRLTLITDPGREGATVYGLLVNETERQVRDVSLLISLEDAGGRVIAEQTTALEATFLGPGEANPFTATFVAPGPAESVEAQVISYRPAEFDRARILVEGTRRIRANDGSTLLTGRLRNSGSSDISIESLSFLAHGSDGNLLGSGRLRYGVKGMPGQSSRPFLASFDGDITGGRIESYADAVQATWDPEPSFEFRLAPSLVRDDQSNLFLLGEFKNGSSRSYWFSFLFVMREGEELLGFGAYSTPIPIAPSGALAFSVTDLTWLIPPEDRSRIEGARVEVETHLDPGFSSQSATDPQPLDLRLSGVEQIGSSLFFRGEIINPLDLPVEAPTVFATLRTTGGQIASAGSLRVLERLPSEARTEFVLALRLPLGVSVPELEYDLRAMGLGS